MLTLKKYQDDALAVLGEFLHLSRSMPLEDAFKVVLAKQARTETYHAIFEDVLSVCLRVPIIAPGADQPWLDSSASRTPEPSTPTAPSNADAGGH